MRRSRESENYPVPPSRVGKKFVGGFFDPKIAKAIKQLALDEDTTIQNLIDEAVRKLFESRGLQ